MATMPTGDEIDIWFKSITADLGLGEPGHSHDPHSAISHINWSASYGLYPEDMTPGHPVPLPEEAHTNHWEVACSAGHVLVLPEGDNDHEDFSAWDRSRLLNIISQLSSTSAQVFS